MIRRVTRPTAPLLVVLVVAALVAGCRGLGPFAVDDVTPPASARVAPVGSGDLFLAGVATVDFTPPAGYPLGGYGGGERREEWPFYMGLGWPGQLALAGHQGWHEDDPEGRHDLLVGATGTHDPLLAKALVLRPQRASRRSRRDEKKEADPTPFALVRLDALATTAEVQSRVVAGVADLGYRASSVVVCATHTHSGMGGYMRPPLARLAGTDNFREELEVRLAKAAIQAIRQAHADAAPATLAVGRTRDRTPDGRMVLAKNRRARHFRDELRDDEVDDEVVLLRVDAVAPVTTAPLATVVMYAVHCTMLDTENHEFSADLGGSIERALEARLGGTALFVNGAQGDVGPRRPQPDPGEPFARSEALGAAFAELVAPVVSASRGAASDRLTVRAAQGGIDLGRPFTVLGPGRERLLDSAFGPASWALEPLALPFDLVLWTVGLTNVRLALGWQLALGLVVDLGPYVDRTTTRVGAVRLTTGREELVLLTLPGEGTHDVGLRAKAAARARGATTAAIVGLALDHVGYIASETEYRRGGYEATLTIFGAGEAEAMHDAHERLLDALYPRS